MTEISLNECLNKIDTIIFIDEDTYIEGTQIRKILNDIRNYIINSIDIKKIYNKQSFMLILKFINFWIQETYESITHTFNNRIKGLRFLIIKFKDNRLYICDREIDFEKDCNTFLYNIINNNGHDYYNEEKNNIEYLIFIYINV